jgi:hypothetical protein
MKYIKYASLTVLTLIVIFAVIVVLVKYKVSKVSLEPSGIGHTTILTYPNVEIQFDYPTYKDWNVSVSSDGIIVYRSKPLFGFIPLLPLNSARIELVDLKDGKFSFRSSVSTLDRVGNHLDPKLIIAMITDTFEIKLK